MKKIIWTFVALVLVFSMCMAIPVSAWDWTWTGTNESAVKPDSYDFSFAIVGDTQILSTLDAQTHETISNWGYSYANHLNKGYIPGIYNWIAGNIEAKNIAHVFALGDITQNRNGADGKVNGRKEFELAKAGWSVLNGKVSYSHVRGNHDHIELYDEFICRDETYMSQFDGYYSNGSNVGRSTYKTLDVGDAKFLLLALDFGANDDVLNWACGVVEQHPDRKVIISTHGYVYNGSRRSSKAGGDWIGDGGTNGGEEIWNGLVRKYENIFMVLCGHYAVDAPFVVRRPKGDHGNTVYEVMINPQEYDMQKAPVGMVAMLYFKEDLSRCSVEYYSTIKDEYCKLNTSTWIFEYEAKTTTAATTAAPETTAATTAAEEKSGCKSLIFMPALPISAGCAAFALRKKKKVK